MEKGGMSRRWLFCGRHVHCECDNEVLVFSVIIPLFKFADALALPQWDARCLSHVGLKRIQM